MTATVFLALLASHLLGDWVVQTDEQATNKTRAWGALIGHVVRYHLVMAGFLLLPVLRDGWPLWRALVALAVSAASHAFIDRRWPVRRLLVVVGSPSFGTVEWGVIAVDQALHLSVLAMIAMALTA